VTELGRRVAAIIGMTAPTTPAGSRKRTPPRFKTRSRPRYPSLPVIRSWQSARGEPTPGSMRSGKSFISIRTLSERPGLGLRREHAAHAQHCSAMGWRGEHGVSRAPQGVPRIYRYVILNRSARSALQRARTAWIHRPLDAQAMHAASQALIGEHDFSAFRSVECQSQTPIRRVDAIEVTRAGDLVSLQITANAYLHHMVRNIVGTLLDVQREADPKTAMAKVLASADRRYAGLPRLQRACICGALSTLRISRSPRRPVKLV